MKTKASLLTGKASAGEGALARPSVDERRVIILDRAARLFDKKGYDATSMRDIATDLGLTKGALYYYFTNKQAILYELHDAFITDLSNRMRAATEAQSDPRERLRTVVDAIIDNVAEYQHYVRVFFQEAQHLTESQFADIREKRAEYARIVEQCFVDGMKAGVFRDDIPSRLATMFTFGSLNWTYQWMRPDGPSTPDEIKDVFFNLLVDGLTARPD